MTFAIDPAAAGFAPGRLDRITEHLQRRYIDAGKIAGCQTLVARHGHVAHFSSLGMAELASSAPVKDDTMWRLYSMSKPITSVALMTLYEQGLFSLNDPVSRYVPSWKGQRVWVSGDGDDMVTEAPRREPTVRDVLCHTAGLTYGMALSAIGVDVAAHPVEATYERLGVQRQKDMTLSKFVDLLGQVPLRYHPGERWQYSYATDVCGALVEVISGQPFDEYLRAHIFEPLGMVDTAFDVPASKVSRFAANYARRKDKSLVALDSPATSTYLTKPTFLSGGGGLVGTTADYFRFTEMLRRGGELDGARILGSRTIELMHANHLAGGQDLTNMAIGAFAETAYAGVGFGLGFAATFDQIATGQLGLGDYYWGGAASTIFWVDPTEDMVVIFMTQLMPSSTFDFRGQLKSIVYSSLV